MNALTAGRQHADFHGTVSADISGEMNLIDLMDRFELDTQKYTPIGLNIQLGESLGFMLAKPQVSILAINTAEIGNNSVDAIMEYVHAHADVLHYVNFAIDIELEEVLLYFKQINILLTRNWTDTIKTFQEDIA